MCPWFLMLTLVFFFLGLFGISSEHADFFPRSSILLALCSRLFNEGGIPQETAIKSTAGWVQLPVNIIDYSFFKKKKCFLSILPIVFPADDPSTFPTHSAATVDQEGGSVSYKRDRWVCPDTINTWLNFFSSFTLSPLVRHLLVETSALGMFFLCFCIHDLDRRTV